MHASLYMQVDLLDEERDNLDITADLNSPVHKAETRQACNTDVQHTKNEKTPMCGAKPAPRVLYELAHHGVRPEDLPDELIDALGAHLLPHSVTATPLSLSTRTFYCTLRRL